MPLTQKIREQIISTFRAEVTEHIQIITEGLLTLEKNQQSPEDRQILLQSVFRAAHSLKGAARAVGVTAVEQLGHGLENVLSDLQKGQIPPSADLFSTCYHALDAIQAVESAYEAGETTPPLKALKSLTELEALRSAIKEAAPSADLAARQTATNDPSSGTLTQTFASAQATSVERSMTPNVSEPTSTSLPTDETIRVRLEKLDSVISQLAELRMAKIRLDQRQAQITQLQKLIAAWQKDWTSARETYNKKKSFLSRQSSPVPGQESEAALQALLPSHSGIKEISTEIASLSREYTNDTVHISLVIDALEQEVKQIRLLPLSTITTTFNLMVRNLTNAANKEIAFEIQGAEVEMDKRVLELVKDPLIHLLRNAIDHGIETIGERQRLGKPKAGKIILTAENSGKDVILSITDDGRGLDMEAIRQSVSRHTNLDSQSISDSELVSWIFNPGISTSPIITDVSGRGVGLDVVRRNIETLQGRIDVISHPGEGASFTLTIPMALTSSHVLLIQVAGTQFAIPLSAVEQIITVKPGEITTTGGQQIIRRGGRPLPLIQMKSILGLPDQEGRISPDRPEMLVVILGSADRKMAFIVEGMLGEQEIVMKGLGKQLARIGGIAGGTVLGNGKIVLILNAADLIKLASRSENRVMRAVHPALNVPATKPYSRKQILVVDDSITTRTLERHILEGEGYIVQVATDGQEALSAIATGGQPDLVITDINMPRIDGFELVSRLKGDPRTNKIPVILVSSLDSSEDKARGIQVGADAYIVKSRFDQGNLLETIQQLIS